MFGKFFNQFLLNIFAYGFGSLFLGIPVIIYMLLTNYLIIGILALGIFFAVVAYFTYRDLFELTEKEYKAELQRITADAQNRIMTEEQKAKELLEATEKEYKAELQRITADAQNRIMTEEQKAK
ncbi:hypothetical protein EBU94_03120, partial [bacterium]|nr:hypothetical protein [bacterium]